MLTARKIKRDMNASQSSLNILKVQNKKAKHK